MNSNVSCPTVTIVIPAKNEERHIRRALGSIYELNYPRDLIEVIVVDNGSTDQTVSLAIASGASVISAPGAFVGGVRNAGARRASSDVLGFLDADCVAGADWLRDAVSLLREEDVGMVGGEYLGNPEGSWVEQVWPGPRSSVSREVRHLPGGSMLVRRHVFEQVGGFDEEVSAGEDDELCRRLRDAGFRILSSPSCHVTHLGYPSTLRGVAKRQVWHGSHQLDVLESVKDPQMILTHMFLIGILLTLAAIALSSGPSASIAAILLAFPPTVMAWKRATGRSHPFKDFLRLLPVGLFFYSGRSVGLMKNYLSLARRSARKNKSPE